MRDVGETRSAPALVGRAQGSRSSSRFRRTGRGGGPVGRRRGRAPRAGPSQDRAGTQRELDRGELSSRGDGDTGRNAGPTPLTCIPSGKSLNFSGSWLQRDEEVSDSGAARPIPLGPHGLAPAVPR